MSQLGKPSDADESSAGTLESFQEELDQYDLLRSAAEASITGTTKAFNTLIQRKKRDQQEAFGQAEKAGRQRHALMIRTMMTIRKSLREVTRVDLGERFRLHLMADDNLGWPRLAIRLQDLEIENADFPQLQVTMHDRHQAATIEIAFGAANERPVRLSLTNEKDAKKLPLILKRCVRSYLDNIGDIVLETLYKSDVAQDDFIEKRAIEEFAEQAASSAGPAISADLFEEDFSGGDFLETLPAIEDVEELQGFKEE